MEMAYVSGAARLLFCARRGRAVTRARTVERAISVVARCHEGYTMCAGWCSCVRADRPAQLRHPAHRSTRSAHQPQVAQKLGLAVLPSSAQEGKERDAAMFKSDKTDTNQDKKLSCDEFRTFYDAILETLVLDRKALVNEKHDRWNGVVKEERCPVFGYTVG